MDVIDTSKICTADATGLSGDLPRARRVLIKISVRRHINASVPVENHARQPRTMYQRTWMGAEEWLFSFSLREELRCCSKYQMGHDCIQVSPTLNYAVNDERLIRRVGEADVGANANLFARAGTPRMRLSLSNE